MKKDGNLKKKDPNGYIIYGLQILNVQFFFY